MSGRTPLPERIGRYGEGMRQRLATFPMERARAVLEELRELKRTVVDKGIVDAGEITPSGPRGPRWSVAYVVRFCRGSSMDLIRRHAEWVKKLRSVLTPLHTKKTAPFYRPKDGTRAPSPRGDVVRQSVPTWLRHDVEAGADSGGCPLCGIRFYYPAEWAGRWRLRASGNGSVPVGRRRGNIREITSGPVAASESGPLGVEPIPFQIDHIIPANRGGPNMAWNLWRICRACNEGKGWFLWPETLAFAFQRLQSVREQL